MVRGYRKPRQLRYGETRSRPRDTRKLTCLTTVASDGRHADWNAVGLSCFEISGRGANEAMWFQREERRICLCR